MPKSCKRPNRATKTAVSAVPPPCAPDPSATPATASSLLGGVSIVEWLRYRSGHSGGSAADQIKKLLRQFVRCIVRRQRGHHNAILDGAVRSRPLRDVS